MLFSAIVATLVSVAAVSAETFTVVVGGNNALTFNPETVTAKQGDTIAFQFQSKNHTVTQSTFVNPCTQMTTPTTGVDSGFLPVPAGSTTFPQWSFTVDNATAPLWFYCKQTGHCQKGMVFALNPSADKTFEAYKAKALASTATPSGGAGGSAAGSPSSTASGAGAVKTGAAMRLSHGAGGLLAVVGLVAGLTL